METLASILAGSGANPYQGSGSGGGISPLLTQMMLAQQMGNPAQTNQLSGAQTQTQPSNMQTGISPSVGGQPPGMTPGQPGLPQGLGSLGALGAMVPLY